MSTGDPVSSVLWLSRLCPASDLSVVKQIWHATRLRNESLGLTGAMIFDGERFCEFLEGHVHDISAVHRDVEFDPQHLDLRVLHVSLETAPRRLSGWRTGYCESYEFDVFTGEDGLQGDAAVSAFIAMLPRCSLSP
jgi:hypothetical protein